MHKKLAKNVMNCKNLVKYLRCLLYTKNNVTLKVLSNYAKNVLLVFYICLGL
jgi:hypothetical protein